MEADRRTILLVEDEALIALSQQRRLESCGYLVRHAATGERAVQAVVEGAHRIDLVLMDVNLGPGIDGTEAAAQILDHRDIPVVFLSSHTEPEVVEKTERITSYGYVVKNSGVVVLDASIKMALRLFEARQQRRRAEDAQRESSRRYRELFANSRDGFVVVDVEGRFLDANEAYCRMLGYTVDELRAMDDFYTVTPERWRAWEHEEIWCNRLLKTGVSGVYEKEYVRKDGSIVPVELQSFTVADDSGGIRYLWGIARDITRRRHDEEALRASERKYRVLFDTFPQGITVSDAKGGIVESNAAAERLLGLARDEHTKRAIDGEQWRIYRPDGTLMPPDEYASVRALREHRPIKRVEMAVERPDGTLTWIDASAAPLDLPGYGVVVTYGDVSERRSAEDAVVHRLTYERCAAECIKALAGNEATDVALERVVTTLRAATSGDRAYIFRHEESAGGEPCMTQIHEACAEGIEPQIENPMLRHLPYRLGAPALLPILRERRVFTGIVSEMKNPEREILASQGIVSVVILPIFCADELWGFVGLDDCRTPRKWTDEDTHILASVADVIGVVLERKRAEEGLRMQALVLDQITDHVTITDLDGTITYVNQAEARTMGRDKGDLIGRSTVVYGEDVEKGATQEEIVSETLRRGGWRGEVINYTADGDERIMDCRTQVVHDKDGTALALCGIATDVTEHRRAEAEIARQLAAKEALLREVHHRLRNNIAGIEGFLTMQASSAVGDDTKRALNDAVARVRSMSRLYENLLRDDEYGTVSIREYAEELVASIAEVYPRSVGVTIDTHVTDFTLDTKRAVAAGMILNELVTNALKYAFVGRDRGAVTVAITAEAGTAALVVADDGVGLGGHPNHDPASGFGLTLVRMLTEQLGGTFEQTSDGNGTRSVARFPW